MKNLKFILSYIRYYLTAQNENDIQLQFVFDLFTNIIKDNNPFYIYKDIEAIRYELLQSKKEISVTDFGTGSSRKRRVKEIAKHSLKSPKHAQLLFRLINHFKPETLLELGTSLGLSTLYQAAVSKNSKLFTLEGCPQTAEIARQNFKKLNIDNIELVTGDFNYTLPDTLKKINNLDYVFFDGNHRKEPTISYFQQCLPLSNNNTFFVFDDIHRSVDMELAWDAIKNHHQVTITLDLFFMGLVFFRKELEKQHFVIKW